MKKEIVHRYYNDQFFGFFDDMDPLIARIYSARGIKNKDQLSNTLQALEHYKAIKDILMASELLAEAVIKKKQILIVGDYDCDGATSTALAISALTQLGGIANYLIPNRFEFGYGLTPQIVDIASRNFNPYLIVTVDNGISSIAGVEHAKAKGIKVIITDHHLAGDTLPNADAIINPNQQGCNFLSKYTAGVGVIFYVMSALRENLDQKKYFIDQKKPNFAELLDLVALGTVADLVPLDYNNRILVAQGLSRMKSTKCRLGLQALIKVCGKKARHLSTEDLGFSLAPRINAAGRLDDISIGVELLLCKTEKSALRLAKLLDSLNEERKQIEAKMKHQAMTLLSHLPTQKIIDGSGIILHHQSWHQGVIGILASRIKEKHHLPTIIFSDFTNDSDDALLKGSARSIEGYHLRNALDRIHKKHPQLIITFGGHAMAAGLSILKEDFNLFKQAFEDDTKKYLSDAMRAPKLYTDGELAVEQMSLHTAKLIQQSGPWGQNFPDPRFDGYFRIIKQYLVGNSHLKMVLAPLRSNCYFNGIAFNIDTNLWPNSKLNQVRVVYKLTANQFQNSEHLQLLIDWIEPLSYIDSQVKLAQNTESYVLN